MASGGGGAGEGEAGRLGPGGCLGAGGRAAGRAGGGDRPGVVEELCARHGLVVRRRRLLSRAFVVRCVLAAALMPDADWFEVQLRLAGLLAVAPLARPWHPAGPGDLARRRAKPTRGQRLVPVSRPDLAQAGNADSELAEQCSTRRPDQRGAKAQVRAHAEGEVGVG